MRKIEILDDVRLRFPGRDNDFDVGVEVGSVSVLLAQGIPFIFRELSKEAVDHLRPIAEKFGYVLIGTETADDMIAVTITVKSRRPALRLIGG